MPEPLRIDTGQGGFCSLFGERIAVRTPLRLVRRLDADQSLELITLVAMAREEVCNYQPHHTHDRSVSVSIASVGGILYVELAIRHDAGSHAAIMTGDEFDRLSAGLLAAVGHERFDAYRAACAGFDSERRLRSPQHSDTCH